MKPYEINCYEILGIPKDSSPQEIKSAYHSCSKRNHPDLGGNEEAQIAINLANEILSDPIQRQIHDKFWSYKKNSVNNYQTPDARQPQSQENYTPKSQQSKYTKNAFDILYENIQSFINNEILVLEKQRARKCDEKFNQYVQIFLDARKSKNITLIFALLSTLAATGSSILFHFHWLWILPVVCWTSFSSNATSVEINFEKYEFTDAKWKDKLKSAASVAVDRENVYRIAQIKRSLEKVAELQNLLNRSTTFDESEENVARRITGTLFLMGYKPISNDTETRMITFMAGDERILVRYRHRDGPATNVTYVERMVRYMRLNTISSGLLFCTPGLSGNGEQLAKKNGILWYTLEIMNQWIDDSCKSEYGGPKENIIVELDHLFSFLTRFTKNLTQHSTKKYRYYR